MIDENLSEHAKKLKELLSENLEDDIDFDEILSDYGVNLKQLEDDMVNYHPRLDLGYVKLNPDAINPKYNYDSDSGFDLYSTETVHIAKFGRALVPTGLSFDIKDLNSPGTVDCFSEDMTILTVNGEKTIKELTLNDIVFSVNEHTFEVEKNIIVNIFNTDVQDILIFETENGILEVTPNSEVYTKRGLIFAKDIKENDEIMIFK